MSVRSMYHDDNITRGACAICSLPLYCNFRCAFYTTFLPLTADTFFSTNRVARFWVAKSNPTQRTYRGECRSSKLLTSC
jgi:hypothetical protein